MLDCSRMAHGAGRFRFKHMQHARGGEIAEAAVVQGLEVYPAKNLREVAEFVAGKKEIAPLREDPELIFQQQRRYDIDLADVKGQESVKRALVTEVGAPDGACATTVKQSPEDARIVHAAAW